MEKILRAIQKGNEGRLGRLLDATPALLESGDYLGDRPLTIAAKHGHVGAVKLLMERGASIDASGFYDETGLHWAAEEGHEEVASFLLSSGAQTNVKDRRHRTPLIRASRNGHVGVVRMLVEHMGIEGLEEGDMTRSTALHYAASHGHREVVAVLLTTGLQANVKGKHDTTPLMEASKAGQLGVAGLLLEHTEGQELDETDGNGRTALDHAALCGHEGMVVYLLTKGAQASSRDENGWSPLLAAAGAGKVGVLRLLLPYLGREGLQEKDRYGLTALHCAVNNLREEMLRCLLFAGADPTIEDNLGRTPRRLAEEGNDDDSDWDTQETEDKDASAERGRCVAVFEWWEREPERHAVLCRATCLHKAFTTQRDMPTSQVPTYLEARVAAGHAVPGVEVVSSLSEGRKKKGQAGVSGKRKAAGKRGEAQRAEPLRHAMLEYVVKTLNEQLLTELLEGFVLRNEV